MEDIMLEKFEKRIATLEKQVQEQQQIITELSVKKNHEKQDRPKIIDSKDYYTYGGSMLL